MIDPKKLHKKFIQLGRMRHKLKNELLAILPEIYKSSIYKKYASSIVEYAGKYGDIAKSTVVKRLRLEKKLEEKPCLKEAIKEVGIHKVAIVANLATPETDEAFADKVKNMSKSAVQVLAKELREKEGQAKYMKRKGKLEEAFLSRCRAGSQKIKIELDEEMSFMFLKLKKKMRENMSNRELMRMILGKMVEEEFPAKKLGKVIRTKKREVAQKSVTGHTLTGGRKSGEIVENTGGNNKKIQDGRGIEKGENKNESRYIPADIKRSVLTETGEKCGYPNCNKPAEIFHHRERFAENKSHKSIIPLCKDHHEFAHNGLVDNECKRPELWSLSMRKSDLCMADLLFRKRRRAC